MTNKVNQIERIAPQYIVVSSLKSHDNQVEIVRSAIQAILQDGQYRHKYRYRTFDIPCHTMSGREGRNPASNRDRFFFPFERSAGRDEIDTASQPVLSTHVPTPTPTPYTDTATRQSPYGCYTPSSTHRTKTWTRPQPRMETPKILEIKINEKGM